MGTNKVLQNAQRNKTQRLFKPLKAQNKRRTLNIIFSEAQPNFRHKLFDYEIFVPNQSTTKVLQLSVKQAI